MTNVRGVQNVDTFKAMHAKLSFSQIIYKKETSNLFVPLNRTPFLKILLFFGFLQMLNSANPKKEKRKKVFKTQETGSAYY